MRSPVWDVALDVNGLVSAGADRVVRLWPSPSKLINNLHNPEGEQRSAAVAGCVVAGGRLLAAGSGEDDEAEAGGFRFLRPGELPGRQQQQRVRRRGGRPAQLPPPGFGEATALRLGPDDAVRPLMNRCSHFVHSLLSSQVLKKRQPSVRQVHTMHGHSGEVWTVALGPEMLLSGAADGEIRSWSRERGCCMSELRGHAGSVFAVALQVNQCPSPCS